MTTPLFALSAFSFPTLDSMELENLIVKLVLKMNYPRDDQY